VLDASAVIAMLRSEPGADIVWSASSDAVISAVNYSEVLKKTIERGGTGEAAAAFVRGLSIAIIPFDETLAAVSADLYPQTKQHGLSLADRACLALGIQRSCKVLTSERRMGLVVLPIKVSSPYVDHPVVDQTGLTGEYDFKLDIAMAGRGAAPPGGDTADAGPNVFAAVEDQLGLKLELKKLPSDVLVIDHIDKGPTAN
jgi:ribonuclease VapC